MEEKEKKVKEFVKNYKVKKIDSKKFKESKINDLDFIFSKNEIMQELGWKNGTFYNRFNQIKEEKTDFESKYTKIKEEGERTEKLLFSYHAFCDFLDLYFRKDLKYDNASINSQDNVKRASNDKSTTRQIDSNLTDNENEKEEITDRIKLYKELIKQKDEMIESLQNQIQELTDIIKVKEQKDYEIARYNTLKEQKQILLNDSEGNRKHGFFARLFRRRNTEEAEN